VWKWVTGPEAELPLRGLVGGSTTFPDYFAFGMLLTNQYNGAQEDYAHITAPGGSPVLGMT
jgi:hypothetical protein